VELTGCFREKSFFFVKRFDRGKSEQIQCPTVQLPTMTLWERVVKLKLITFLQSYMYILIFQKSYTYISQSIQHINTTHDDRWSEDIFQRLMFEEKKRKFATYKISNQNKVSKIWLIQASNSRQSTCKPIYVWWYTLTYRFEILTLITRIQKFVLGMESFSYPDSCPNFFLSSHFPKLSWWIDCWTQHWLWRPNLELFAS
jgi:hypothetical protein